MAERSHPDPSGPAKRRTRETRGPGAPPVEGARPGGKRTWLQRRRRDEPQGPAPEADPVPLQPSGTLDVIAAAGLAVLAAFAMAFLAQGSVLRVALVLPVLFFAPGYLLLQALPIPIFAKWSRAVHGLLAIGISPAVVGLLALSTALIPGAFRPVPIVAVITLACLALAGVALYRRNLAQAARETPRPATT